MDFEDRYYRRSAEHAFYPEYIGCRECEQKLGALFVAVSHPYDAIIEEQFKIDEHEEKYHKESKYEKALYIL